MDGINKIIDFIMAEAAGECREIAAEGAAECERIRAEYSKSEQEEYWRLIDVGAKEAERRLERLTSLAALEAKKIVLTTQQTLIAQAFDLAAQKLLRLPAAEYAAFLSKLAVSASMTGTETICLSAADLNRVGPEVLKQSNAALKAAGRNAALTLSDAPADIRGGIILSGGDIECNCSIDALIGQYKNELLPSVSELLFK